MERLMERKGAFDHILLETTGLADPGLQLAYFFYSLLTVNRPDRFHVLAE